MIEFCSKKRMIAAIVILTIVSSVVLVLENQISVGHDLKNFASLHSESDNASKLCGASGVSVLRECEVCTEFEQKSLDACKATNYIEKVECRAVRKNDGAFYRSCRTMIGTGEQSFWAFECTSAAVGVASYGVVYLRQKRLERLLFEKVNRQIAAGV